MNFTDFIALCVFIAAIIVLVAICLTSKVLLVVGSLFFVITLCAAALRKMLTYFNI